MRVGDKVRQHRPSYGTEYPGEPMTATCVYIHPQRRFYVLEFDFNGKKFRESYKIIPGTPMSRQ